MKQVQGAGRSGLSLTEIANVVVSGKAGVDDAIYGGNSDANSKEGHYPVGTVNVIICGSATVGSEDDPSSGNVFGAGRDTYATIVGPSTKKVEVTVTQNCTIYGSVFGGGYRGSVGENPSGENPKDDITSVYGGDVVTIKISGGTVKGSVYGGGRGGIDNAQGGAGSGVGRSIVRGGISIELMGDATICGSVYGGGKGETPAASPADPYNRYVGSVFGDVCITVGGNAQVQHDVYGGGAGVGPSTSVTADQIKKVALVTGDVSVSINGGKIGGSVFGGGQFGLLGNENNPGNMTIILGDATIGGDVYCGGLGAEGQTSTYISERSISIDGTAIVGSVYGGSRSGNDNCQGSLPDDSPTYTSEINIISGDIASGTSGNVYGGGYAGHSFFNSTINVGVVAGVGTPPGELHILSVFGGPNVGVRDSETLPQLMKGNTAVNICGGGYAPGFLTITGDIFGGGDYCDVLGKRIVSIEDFDQGENKVLSLQKADEVTVTDSTLRISGNVDGQSTGGSNRMSLNRIGMLTLRSEESRTIIELDYAARSISGYSSEYSHGEPSEAEAFNKIKMNNGKTFFILGDNEGNSQVTEISGKTLFQSDENTYYGAFVIGDLSGSVDASFWIIKDKKPEPATTVDYKRGSGNGGNDTRAWYISGSFRVEKVAVFDGSKESVDLDYTLPKISTESGIRYMGYHMELNSPGSLQLVQAFTGTSGDTSSGYRPELILKFGQGTKGSGLLIFDEPYGVTLSDSLNPGTKSVDGSSGLHMKMSLQMNPGFDTTGFVGSVIIHFAEIMDYKDGDEVVSSVSLGIFDVKVSVYLKVPLMQKLELKEPIVMREGSDTSGYKWSGTTNIYLPALENSVVGHYKITRIYDFGTSSDGIHGSLSIRSVHNDEGKDGWIDANHRTPYEIGSTLSNGVVELGTGAVYSPVLEVAYNTDKITYTDADGSEGRPPFHDVCIEIAITEIRGGEEISAETVVVHLIPEEVSYYDVVFYDKVIDTSGSWINFSELFTIEVEFGRSVRDYYIAYGVPEKPSDTTPGICLDYLEDVKAYLKTDECNKVLVSTDKEALRSQASGYIVGSVEEFLNVVIGQKPDTEYTNGGSGPSYIFRYKENNPSWNNGTYGLSRFNFERPITQDQNVYSAYGVELTLKAVVDGKVRTGLITPDVIIPVPDTDNGAIKIPDQLKGSVRIPDGYTQGIWSLDFDGNEPINTDTSFYTSMTIFIHLGLSTYNMVVEVVDEENSSEQQYTVTGGKESGGKTEFNVESSLAINVTSGDGYYPVWWV